MRISFGLGLQLWLRSPRNLTWVEAAFGHR